MTRNHRCPHGGQQPAGRRRDAGIVSLEYVLVLPVLAIAVVTLLQVVGLARDVLLLHEAARAGVRAAVTSTGTGPVEAAVRAAAPEIDPSVQVDPVHRSDGQIVRVTVHHTRTIGPVSHPLQATAVGRVEPIVGREPATPPGGVPWRD